MSGAEAVARSDALRDLVTAPARRDAYLAAGLWDEATLPDAVHRFALERPERTAVVDRDGRAVHRYGELDGHAASVAAWLGARGVGVGDVVSVQLNNCYEFVVVALGALWLGAVVNTLLPVYRRRELRHVFSVARPKVVCTPVRHRGHDHAQETAALIAECGYPMVHLLAGEEEPAGPTDPEGPTAWLGDVLEGPGAPAPAGGLERAGAVSELIFTSGTEAAPKAIMHTEQTANFSMRTARHDLAVTDGDVVFMPSPIGHSTGFNYGVRFALYHGLPLLLQDRWDPEVAVDLIAGHEASYTLASTTFLQDLVGVAERRGVALPTMTRFGCGGAPVPADLVHRAASVGLGVLRLYGSTEVLVATWNRPGHQGPRQAETDGPALSDVEVEVRDGDGRRCSPGEPGEIWVRGPNTCVGFYEDPERTAATFAPKGWLRSGDLATMDEDGYLTVVGRKKEIIIRGGLNITPREIEDLVLEFEEVERAAVVGLPDERLGERTCLCVVLTPGATLDLDGVVTRLKAGGLATYKLPERLEVLDALPMTASGKVQKFEIVARLGAR